MIRRAPDVRTGKTAANAGLIYISDSEEGFSGRKCGRGFTYSDERGNSIAGEARDGLKGLAIAPAWADVWIAPQIQAHIVATGRDDRGSKQYIFHPQWRQQREYANFSRLLPFGEALPQLREALNADWRQHSLCH